MLMFWVGGVFRVSPDELSFSSIAARKAIYTHRKSGSAQVPKSEFYDVLNSGFDVASLGTERDPHLANKKRSYFAAAMSAKGLAQQEPVIQNIIDAWIEKLEKLGQSEKGMDMTSWFIYVSFDILGAMAFGESFGCIEREASHYWLDLLLGHMWVIILMDNIRRYPLALYLAQCIPSKWTVGIRNKFAQYAHDKVAE